MKFLPFLMLIFCAGCSIMPWRHRAARAIASIDKMGAPVVAQRGDVQEPAHASTETTVTTLPIPAGSVVAIPAAPSERSSSTCDPHPASPATITLAAATEIRTETKKQSVEGPKTYAPPAPPSAVEVAEANGVRWSYIAGGVCALLAVIAFTCEFHRAAAWLAVGAVAIPTLAKFANDHAAALVGVAAAAGAFAYWHSWHVMKSPAAPVAAPHPSIA